jgi:hypothetical protein
MRTFRQASIKNDIQTGKHKKGHSDRQAEKKDIQTGKQEVVQTGKQEVVQTGKQGNIQTGEQGHSDRKAGGLNRQAA